jgi:hypothetical protein
MDDNKTKALSRLLSHMLPTSSSSSLSSLSDSLMPLATAVSKCGEVENTINKQPNETTTDTIGKITTSTTTSSSSSSTLLLSSTIAFQKAAISSASIELLQVLKLITNKHQVVCSVHDTALAQAKRRLPTLSRTELIHVIATLSSGHIGSKNGEEKQEEEGVEEQGMNEDMKDNTSTSGSGTVTSSVGNKNLGSLTHDTLALFVDALKCFLGGSNSSKNSTNNSDSEVILSLTDASALQSALQSDSARIRVPPEAILALPPSMRHAVWRACPSRRGGDLLFACLQLERGPSSISDIEVGLDLVDANRARPKLDSNGLRNAIQKTKAAISRRHKSLPMQTLAGCVRGDPEAYIHACAILQGLWERDHNPRWVFARQDLYMLLVQAEQQNTSTSSSSSSSSSTAGRGQLPISSQPTLAHSSSTASVSGLSSSSSSSSSSSTAQLSSSVRDPLATVVMDIQRLLLGLPGSSVNAILTSCRALVKRRPAIDKKTANTEITQLMKKLVRWAKDQQCGIFSGAEFNRPVFEDNAEKRAAYLRRVQKPMDFSLIITKARSNTYNSLDEAEADIHMIFENSLLYNGKDHDVTILAEQIDAYFRHICTLAARNLALQVASDRDDKVSSSISGSFGVYTTFDRPSTIIQLLMILADPLLSRHAVHIAFHSGIASAARSGGSPENDPNALAAITLLVAGDVGYLIPPTTRKLASTLSSSSSFTSLDTTIEATLLHSSKAYSEFAAALCDILSATPSSSSSLFKLTLKFKCSNECKS